MNDQKNLTNPPTPRPILRPDYRASVPLTTRAHLEVMGAVVPASILSDNAYVALLLIASARHADLRPRVCVDAYTHTLPGGDEWVIECHGAYNWQESRYSPRGWQTMYARYLREAILNGYMPLADAWLSVCERIAEERPNGSMLPDGQQWAREPEGGPGHAA